MRAVARLNGKRIRELPYKKIQETMNEFSLSATASIQTVSETATQGTFQIEGLYTGYGLTIGNALRRVLISSLPGAAITRVKIKGVSHEFSTLDGLSEDIVELTLNLKRVRFHMYSDEPQTLILKAKGEQEITAGLIETNASVDVVNPEAKIGRLTAKNADLDMEITVERGLGYVPVEASKAEKLPIGVIALDAIFTPIVNVNFTVENMRVGDRTDFNRLKLVVTTDGSITPSAAVAQASVILGEHYAKIASIEVMKAPEVAPKAEKKAKKAKKES